MYRVTCTFGSRTETREFARSSLAMEQVEFCRQHGGRSIQVLGLDTEGSGEWLPLWSE